MNFFKKSQNKLETDKSTQNSMENNINNDATTKMESTSYTSIKLDTQQLNSLVQYLANIVKQELSTQINQNVNNNLRVHTDFDNNVRQYLDQIYKGLVFKDKSTGELFYALKRLLDRQEKSTSVLMSFDEKLKKIIDSQVLTIAKLNATITEQNAIIKKQHESIIRFENDLIYKTQKDLIMEMIGIADQIKYTLSDQVTESNYELLLDSVKQLGEWVESSLQTVAVRKTISDDYSIFNRKTQEVVETVNTANPDEDGCFKSILPGYVWAIPLTGSAINMDSNEVEMYQFVIRPEQVARLKFVKSDDNLKNDNNAEAELVIHTLEDNDSNILDNSIQEHDSCDELNEFLQDNRAEITANENCEELKSQSIKMND